MIRRSAAIATVAVLLSLFVHFVVVGVTFRDPPERPAEAAAPDNAALGNTFDDVADTQSDPVEPEPASVPDPAVQPPAEPERVEPPTSYALVASDNPQETNSPDTGSAEVVQPDMIEPTEPPLGDTPEPGAVEPSGGDDRALADTPVLSSVEPETAETAPAASVALAPTPEAPEPLAAEPDQVAPTLPVASASTPEAIPVIPATRETVDPAVPETTVEPAPDPSETAATETGSGESDLAVTASLRPRLAPERPSAPPAAQTGYRRDPDLVMESPLTVYQRTGVFGGSASPQGSRGPGNSNVTNYAGQVLVHLNRTPSVRVRTPGTARVTFEINRDGTLAWVTVSNSTGTHEFDSLAREQVRRAVPFPRPPEGANRRISFSFRSN